jgi:quercetin dioxygenase-like cupin family protein
MSIPPSPADAERERWHLGGLLTITAAAEDTNGSLAVVEERAARGYATPAHVHGREDETLFVIEGAIDYTVDGTRGTVTAGQAAFLPRGLAHQFTVVSERAHFLVIITPGGFERFFGEVSPAASAHRPPEAADQVRTDPADMVRSAAVLGTTVFTKPGPWPELLDTTGLVAAYRAIEDVVAGAGPLPSPLTPLVDLLVGTAATRLADHPVHARSLVLLGILAERAEQDVPVLAPELLAAVRPDWPEPAVLAAAYLFAHFPAQAEDIDRALAGTALPEPDRARLRRCLARPDPDVLGRVWPSPTTWQLDPDEQERDRQWRAGLDLSPEAATALWQSKTAALLAYMGARAEHAVERSCRA